MTLNGRDGGVSSEGEYHPLLLRVDYVEGAPQEKPGQNHHYQGYPLVLLGYQGPRSYHLHPILLHLLQLAL